MFDFGPCSPDDHCDRPMRLDDLIIDDFAGGGGVSEGFVAALGRSPDVAYNHDEWAIAMHCRNHPDTLHIIKSLYKVDITDQTRGRPVLWLHGSPDCRHFSRARGSAPTSKSVRGLAWVLVTQLKQLGHNRPRIISLENVVEFETWDEFDLWKKALRNLGYKLQFKRLRACDFGAGTIRMRLYMIGRRDGRAIVWPTPTHGHADALDVLSGAKKPWVTAADLIDWSLPVPSIFDTSEAIMGKYGLRSVRPLSDNTLRRIAAGIVRYVLEADEPFFITLGQHGGANRSAFDPMSTVTASDGDQNAIVVPNLVSVAHGDSGGKREYPIDAPIGVTTSRNDKALIVPTLIQMGYGERPGERPRALDLGKPLGTVTAGGNKFAYVSAAISPQFGKSGPRSMGVPLGTITAGGGGKAALVTAFMAQHNLGVVGHAITEPVSTLTGTCSQQNLVTAHMLSLKGSARRTRGMDEPLSTICAGGGQSAMVVAFLTKYYGTRQAPELKQPFHTITTKHRFSLVTVTIQGQDYVITDIGMRMLSPRELYRAQGFREDYCITPEMGGKTMGKAQQTAKCGNSVCPPVMEAIVRANCPELAVAR